MLWLTGKWKVGLASVYLPGAPNRIPLVVTSHSSAPTHLATPTPPKRFFYKNFPTEEPLSNLILRRVSMLNLLLQNPFMWYMDYRIFAQHSVGDL